MLRRDGEVFLFGTAMAGRLLRARTGLFRRAKQGAWVAEKPYGFKP
jgi:hypothetical protein